MNQLDVVQITNPGNGIGDTQRRLQYLSTPGADSDPEKVRSAARELASYFVHMLIREMRRSIPKNPLLYGGKTEEIFQDFLDEEYAGEMVRSNQLGLADTIYKSIENLLKQSPRDADSMREGS